MQPPNVSKDEKPRPAGVPEGAYWDAGDNEWVLPERNAAGDFHGLVKWWRPDGTLCCATDHVDGKPHGKFTRYHENGEVSRTGTFVKGTLHGVNVFSRSTANTTENFPSGLGKHIWRCEMDFVEGRTTEGRLFDRDGRRVMEDGQPFPTERPAGVPAGAHFRKPQGQREYCWVAGETAQVGDDWHEIGNWRYWTPAGVLQREEPYEDGELHGTLRIYDDAGALAEEQRYEHGERRFDRPRGVPEDARFDGDDELWVHDPPTDSDNRMHGDRQFWTASGVLRKAETYDRDEIVRVREFLDDGSPAQDSTLFDGGVPRRKWFRKTADEELQSFPSVTDEHPDAREVEYLFSDHGLMSSFKITDEAGAVLEQRELYRNAGNDEDQERFASIDAASAAWIEEGSRYTSLINKWLHELYNQDEPSFEEPTFDRHDLERGVIDSVEELNKRGDGALAHTRFPLYYDGIGKVFWDRYGLVVDRVLDTGTETYARVAHPSRGADVVRITADRIEPVPGLWAFGASYDKRYLAFALDDRIEVRHGTECITLPYPKQYQHARADALETRLTTCAAAGVKSLRVCPNGSDVIVTCVEGIYIVNPERTQRLYPLDANLDTYVDEHGGGVFELNMRFPNADVSPSGDRITCGGMLAPGNFAHLAIYRRGDAGYVLDNTSGDNAFFPAQAIFHRSRPHIAFAATLYASLRNALANTTFRIDLDDLKPGEITEFGGGISRERGRVTVVASFGDGFLLGFDNGYIRWMGVDENAQLLGYCFAGGSILDIDVSADGRSFTVASDSGLVSRFTLGDKPSPNLIATMPVSDDSRVAFFRTFAPLRW
jgi:antitoxin component YwqK of YwqJK toxin-antitoxin module